MNIPKLNTIYIYKSPRPFNKISVRAYDKYKYLQNGIIIDSNVFRYALTLGKITVLIVSKETDTNKMKKFIKGLELDTSYKSNVPLETEHKYD